MHDILEDVAQHNSEEKICELFGDRICNMVIALTDSSLVHGNRAARKARSRIRLESASAETKTIKMADIIGNFIDIQKNDPGFSIIFAHKIELLLPCLSNGNPTLHSKLSELLTCYKNLRKPVQI